MNTETISTEFAASIDPASDKFDPAFTSIILAKNPAWFDDADLEKLSLVPALADAAGKALAARRAA